MRNLPTTTRYLLIANLLIFLLAYVLKSHGIDLNAIGGLHYFTADSFHYYGPEVVAQYAYYLNTIGASGAVFGILFAFGWLYPDVPMFLLFIPVPIRARIFVIIYAVVELFAGLGSVAGLTADHVAHFAHLGGFLFGWLLILYWKKRNWQEPLIFTWWERLKERFGNNDSSEGKDFDNYHYHKRV